jgi:Flp pilus assembly protein TadG
VVADNPVKMEIGIRRKWFCGCARGRTLLGGRTSLADLRRAARRRLRREDGQSLVEFAIVLPVLLMIVTGIIQFGSLYNKYITLTDAARNGAQTLAIGRGLGNPCGPAVTQTTNSASAIGLTSAQVTTSFSSIQDTCGTSPYTGVNSGNEVAGDQAIVTASQPATLNVFGVGFFSFNLSASASDAVQ